MKIEEMFAITPYRWRKLTEVEKRVALMRARRFQKRFTEIVNFMERNQPKPQSSAFPLSRSS